MLIEKTQVNEVYCFKLVNGDEIVARIEEVGNDHYTVSRPTTVMPGPQGIGLIQSLFSMKSDSRIRLDTSHVMMMCEVDPRMRDHYIQTVTGIQPVTNDRIITS